MSQINYGSIVLVDQTPEEKKVNGCTGCLFYDIPEDEAEVDCEALSVATGFNCTENDNIYKLGETKMAKTKLDLIRNLDHQKPMYTGEAMRVDNYFFSFNVYPEGDFWQIEYTVMKDTNIVSQKSMEAATMLDAFIWVDNFFKTAIF